MKNPAKQAAQSTSSPGLAEWDTQLPEQAQQYVPPRTVPLVSSHDTLDDRRVKLAPEVNPHLAPTDHVRARRRRARVLKPIGYGAALVVLGTVVALLIRDRLASSLVDGSAADDSSIDGSGDRSPSLALTAAKTLTPVMELRPYAPSPEPEVAVPPSDSSSSPLTAPVTTPASPQLQPLDEPDKPATNKEQEAKRELWLE